MSFEHQIVVRFKDVDRAGIAFFGSVFDYSHAAFEELLAVVLPDLNEAFGRTDRAGRPRCPGGEDDGNANKESGDGNTRGQSAARESHGRQCKGAHRDRGERKGRNSACPKHPHSRRKNQKHAAAAAAGPERLVDKLFPGRCRSAVLRQPLYCSDEFFLARIPEPPPRPDQRPVLQSK